MTVLSKEEFKLIITALDAELYETEDGFCFKINNEIYRLSLVQDLGGYVIEYAESEIDANNNFFEDLDVISNDCPKDELIAAIIDYIRNI
ncbi:MAG: hypothetical protein IJI66_11295 [Erysipelotrichaceae bacterium]|nr:hypothetical protein [Erysipelotrichaceae bacterium]